MPETASCLASLVLIGCSAAKLSRAAPAAELYTGQLFVLSRRYAEHFGSAWRILSAKYGVVDPRQVIEPYDRALRKMKPELRRQWAAWCQCGLAHVLEEVGATATCGKYRDFPRIVILAGRDYVQPLLQYTLLAQHRNEVDTPLAGLGIGKQLAFLSRAVQGIGHPTIASPVWMNRQAGRRTL